MATMQRLTGTTQTPNASTSITSVSSPSAATFRAGESLAGDLMKIMGEGAKTTQTFYTASKQAAERVASDRNTELAKFMANVEANTNYDDPASLATAQKEIALKQAELAAIKFDLEDAQSVFDETYTKHSAKQVASINARLKKRELVKTDDLNFEKIKLDSEIRYTAGNYLTTQEIKNQVSSATAYKRFKKEDVEYELATKNTTAFRSKIDNGAKEVLESVGFNPEKGMTIDVARKLFNKEFGAWGTMDDKGKINWKDDFENRAKDEILREWKLFESKVGAVGKPAYNEKFYLTKSSASKMEKNAQTTYLSSADILNNIETAENGFIEANNEIPLTPAQIKDTKISIGSLKNTYDETKMIEDDLASGDINKVRGLLFSGKDMTMTDNITGGTRTVKLSASKYKQAANYFLNKSSKEAMGIRINNDADKAAFITKLNEVKRYEEITGMNSPITKKYGDAFESGKPVKAFGYNDILQLIAYDDFAASYDEGRTDSRNVTQTLKQAIADLDPNDKSYKAKVVQAYHSIIGVEKNTRLNEVNSKKLDAKIAKWVEEVETTGLNAQMAYGADVAMKNYIVNVKGIEAADDVLYDTKGIFINQTFDYGGYAPSVLPFAKPDQRSLLPFGLSSREAKSAIDTIRKNFSKTYYKTIGAGDVLLENFYNPASKNIAIRVKLRDNPKKVIGTVTYSNGAILMDKGE